MAANQRVDRIRGRRGVGLVLAWLVLTASGARAQSVGANLGGVVTDDTGARLPGVTVTITNKSNGRAQTLVTGSEGNYRAVALQPAPYDVVFELAGFNSVTRTLVLTVGADLTVDVKLGVAALAENLTVVGETPLVEVAKSQPSSVVVGEQVSSLPVLERNFLALAQLLPGSGPDNSRTQRFTVTKFGGVADQRNGYTTVIDGGTIDDAIWGSPTINLTQDAVQEFKVFRNQFDAQYGNALSAVVSVVTKSGSNQLSGSGFLFARDKRLNARNAFATTTPPFDQQRVGGTLGGPIKASRTHFFGAYEYNNVDTVKIISLPASNPFAARENGVFPSGQSNHNLAFKLDHRLNDHHSLMVRYARDDQESLRSGSVSSDTQQTNDFNRADSLVVEESWIMAGNKVNNLRFHLLDHNLYTLANSSDVSISRPSVTTGQSTVNPQYFPRKNFVLTDTFYVNTPRHDLKFGGDLTLGRHEFEAHFFEHGQFVFQTDAPFDRNDSRTWPQSFTIQKPGFYKYNSTTIGLFAQDDWRLADRWRLNAGLRYDLDTNIRLNSFFEGLLADPTYKGLELFVHAPRGNDTNNLQPRLGTTWDIRGNGTLVARGGFGMYVTRNRPWMQMRTMNQITGSAVRIEDPQLLQYFPDVNAVLGGKTLDQFLASGGARQLGTVISDDFVLPYSLNTTGGVGWQMNARTSLDVDYVHVYGANQLGFTDRNVPATGRISATNPRPAPQFTSVLMLENYTKSWYDALETQLRTRVRGADSLQLSYTLSRTYLDGVDFFQTQRGTQRTPDEKGYNLTDQRHNLTLSGSFTLPWDLQLAAIVKLISGSPFRVQAGFDIDGDLSIQNDRPAGLPSSVGRERVDDSLRIINELRVSRGLAPIDKSLLKLDPFRTVDLRLTKVVRLPGTRRIEVLAEAFNLLNAVNYQPFTPNQNINSAAFLVRNSARDARQVQLGARLAF
ncbi:MAG: TonB-dependent receptor [Vicinamibacterales bacterium]